LESLGGTGDSGKIKTSAEIEAWPFFSDFLLELFGMLN